MAGIKNTLLNEHLLISGLCIAIIAGPAISALFTNDLTFYPDCKTYFGLAHFDFNQSPVRRYRVIVPFAAAGLNFISGGVFARLAPAYFKGDFSLAFSFFIVNTFLMALFGQLIYRYARAFGLDKYAAIAGTLVMLTCRYTAATAAFALTDSLFLVTVVLTLLGIKIKSTGMLAAAIFIGPFAKESFVFIAPLILFFSHLNKLRLIVLFLLSGLLVFSFRYGLDALTMKPFTGSIKADFGHLYFIGHNISKLFSFRTFFQLFMNVGLWVILPFMAVLLRPGWGKELLHRLDKYLALFMVSVLFQMLLSGSMERMFYISMPLICVIVAFSVDEITRQIRLIAQE